MIAEETTKLIEAENHRTQQMMASMQKSYLEAMPPLDVTQPRDLFNKTNAIPQF